MQKKNQNSEKILFEHIRRGYFAFFSSVKFYPLQVVQWEDTCWYYNLGYSKNYSASNK